MIKIFTINQEKKIHHLIEIGEEFIVLEDNYIRLEFGNGFDWIKHSLSCCDCKAFIDSMWKSDTAFKWYLESNDRTFILDTSHFEKGEYFENSFESENSKAFTGVKLKLRKIADIRSILENLQSKLQEEEKYEYCAELKSAIKIATG